MMELAVITEIEKDSKYYNSLIEKQEYITGLADFIKTNMAIIRTFGNELKYKDPDYDNFIKSLSFKLTPEERETAKEAAKYVHCDLKELAAQKRAEYMVTVKVAQAILNRLKSFD